MYQKSLIVMDDKRLNINESDARSHLAPFQSVVYTEHALLSTAGQALVGLVDGDTVGARLPHGCLHCREWAHAHPPTHQPARLLTRPPALPHAACDRTWEALLEHTRSQIFALKLRPSDGGNFVDVIKIK